MIKYQDNGLFVPNRPNLRGIWLKGRGTPKILDKYTTEPVPLQLLGGGFINEFEKDEIGYREITIMNVSRRA